MEIMLGIWVGLIFFFPTTFAQSKYDPRYVSQHVHYDDDQPNYSHYQPKYPVSSHPSDPYQSHGQYNEPEYRAPTNSPYRQPLDNSRSYNYYEPSNQGAAYHSTHEQPPKHGNYIDLKDSRSSQEVKYIKPKYPEEETPLYDSEGKTPTHAEKPEELQYSHEPEEPSHHHQEQPSHRYPESHHHQEQSSHYYPGSTHHQEQPSSHPAGLSHHHERVSSYPSGLSHYQEQPSSHPAGLSHHQEQPSSHPAELSHQEKPKQSHPAPVPHDPKLPLYFTMYEKRIIQDPLDKYGKGPWRYLTYGHGITYGSKEPGKVFERGYGYIRALGRDHCKEDKNLCPPRDDKPFEYDGRKEPYFGYRPH